MSAVDVRGLRIELVASGDDIADGIDFAIAPGELLGLVGESGSGKTTVAMALLGFVRRGARIAAGKVAIDGEQVVPVDSPATLQAQRGRLVAYVPQDPGTALNPALRLRRQLLEVLPRGGGADGGEAARIARVREVLGEVGLPSDDAFLARFPHQLSGGQQQRVAIAMAVAPRPRLLVLDEPTTGLDVSTQRRVLETVATLCSAHRIAAVYVSHDLAVVGSIAQRVLVLYGGRVVELGPSAAVFDAPRHPYTRALLDAIPAVDERRVLTSIPGHAPAPGTRPGGCVFHPRCDFRVDACTAALPPLEPAAPGHLVRCLRAHELPQHVRLAAPPPPVAHAAEPAEPLLAVRTLSASHGAHQVLHDVSLAVAPGECLALVGESGSGKTTLSRCLIGLHEQRSGEIAFHGTPLAPTARRRDAEVRRAMQYVFQNPYASLHPRRTVGASVAQPLEHFFGLKGRPAQERVGAALERVALPGALAARFPGELSGGERQRAAIARALVCEPELLICDEVTSALDVSVQAAIVELLQQLREEGRLSMLFVTHNLALVRTLADRVAVLRDGRLVEVDVTDAVLDRPQDPYTRELLADTPRLVAAGA